MINDKVLSSKSSLSRDTFYRSGEILTRLGVLFTYLSHGVGLGAVHNLGGSRTDGGVGSHDLRGIGHIIITVVCVCTCHEGNGSSDDR